jgi:hypothetical protein
MQTWFLIVSVPGSIRSSSVRVRQGAPVERGGVLDRPGTLFSRRPSFRLSAHGRERDLTSSLAIHPMPLPCSTTPVESMKSRHCDSIDTVPGQSEAEDLDGYNISGLLQGLSIRCLRFTSDIAVPHARLVSGWRATPLPGGSRTLWTASKGFRLHFHSPFQDFSCRNGFWLQILGCFHNSGKPDVRILSLRYSSSRRP